MAASVTAAVADVSGAATGGAVTDGAVCLGSGTLHVSGAGCGIHRRTLDIGGGALNIGSRTLHIGRALNVAGRLAVVVYRRSVVY